MQIHPDSEPHCDEIAEKFRCFIRAFRVEKLFGADSPLRFQRERERSFLTLDTNLT